MIAYPILRFSVVIIPSQQIFILSIREESKSMGVSVRRDTINLITKHRRSMGQRQAKQHMQAGVKLYHQRHYAQAINKWRQSLNSNAEDRFITLGYLAQALCDQGEYEGMLSYALSQMQLATDQNDSAMKCEAFLNLAKAYERLADFTKALQYGKASLDHPSMDPRTPGYAHLTIALAHLGMSQFQQCLESFESAMNVANETSDRLLELQICVGLGALFTLLRDITKALIFLRNALAIVQSVTVDDVHAKYRCLILYHLSVALRMKGSLVDAKEACDEASQLAVEMGNRAIHARCMCSLADIYRELGESEAKETITKSWARYEDAYRVMRGANDKMGEVLVLSSMAKSASESRSHYTGQCECQAIQLNKKCIEIANLIGCKHVVLKCHLRLAELYSQLNDDDSEETARRAASRLTQEMQLFCNFCGQRYGLKDESLQALRCSHIFHEKCLHTYLLQRTDQNCPKCRCRAVLSDNISIRSSIASTADVQSPSTSFAPPGGVATPLVSVAAELGDITPQATLTRRPQPDKILRGAEKDIDRVDRSLARLKAQQPSEGVSTSATTSETMTTSSASASSVVNTGNHNKPPPPPRKPCCSQAALPPSSIVALPPAMPLAEDGPLVITHTPTVTDV
uniref:RING-type domain-containing protein n=1 Tax=Caenorhabditis japonica TaxID=281687 RepID=A0A8R1DWQ8_CAEJA